MTDPDALRFAKHFERAQGWLGLDKPLTPAYRERPEVLELWSHVRMAAKQWAEAEPLLRRLQLLQPGEAQHWVNLAYTVRRLRSLAEAEPILREGVRRFPEVGLIRFNLACYAAQQGRLAEVTPLLEAAFRFEPGLREIARSDPDLEPYRQSRAVGH